MRLRIPGEVEWVEDDLVAAAGEELEVECVSGRGVFEFLLF